MHLVVMMISTAPALCQVCTTFWGYKDESDLKSLEDLRAGTATRSLGARRRQMDMLEKITWLMSKAEANSESSLQYIHTTLELP